MAVSCPRQRMLCDKVKGLSGIRLQSWQLRGTDGVVSVRALRLPQNIRFSCPKREIICRASHSAAIIIKSLPTVSGWNLGRQLDLYRASSPAQRQQFQKPPIAATCRFQPGICLQLDQEADGAFCAFLAFPNSRQ